MNRPVAALLIAFSSAAFADDPKPAFEAADIHASPKSTMPFGRTSPVRAGRYEIKQATMVDLIRFAYGFDADKIVGGPNWLELDRFDVVGKVPEGSTPENHKLMLQSLLADRFKLAHHEETRPLPTYSLVLGKKHQLKEPGGSEETGCKPQSSSAGAPAEGGSVIRLMTTTSAGGPPVQINLGPGMVITYHCRNVSMADFAAGLRTMMGANLGPNPVRDETGLAGKWNFDLRYSMALMGPMMPEGGERISVATAIEKQLGLKLEEKPIPTKVLVVDRVNRDPGANPPQTAEALPPLPVPTEFEVASVKLADPGAPMGGRFQMQPGGRLVITGMPLRFLIDRAFNNPASDQVVGAPPFDMASRYDILAKLPAESALAATGQMDMEAMAPLLLKLLVDRFKLKYHTEEKPVTAYTLLAGRPKMKKADPASRISCKNANAPAGAPPGSRMLTCQNVTMAQFAERLHRLTPDMTWPVEDATGLEGGWDLSIVFSMRPMAMMMMGAGRPPDAAGGGGGGSAVPTAPEPVGGQTIFEAIEKQLGLKLEKRQRNASVIVIDHIEPRPTEN
jgi:uncharacterized protein (TIGR03435 family)